MKISAFGVVLLTCGLTLAGESSLSPGYYQCTSLTSAKTVYFSAIFEGPGNADVGKAFSQVLSDKYGYTGYVNCPLAFKGPTVVQKMQQDQANYAAQLRKQGKTVVETGWTFNGRPALGTKVPPQTASVNQETKPDLQAGINGVYTGTYTCAKGPVDLKLTLTLAANGILSGTFTFYLPPGSHTKAYTFSLGGPLDRASGKFNLYPSKWEGTAPPNYMMVGLKGVFEPQSGKVSGTVDYSGCGQFEARKGRDD